MVSTQLAPPTCCAYLSRRRMAKAGGTRRWAPLFHHSTIPLFHHSNSTTKQLAIV